MGKLIRALLDLDALVIAIDSTDVCEYARKIHNLTPTTTALLGRSLTAGAMMGAALKNEGDVLTLTLNGGGPAGSVVVCADAVPNVRGYVINPHADLPLNIKGKIDVGGALGSNGFITVTKDIGLKQPYTGRVELVSGEVAQDVVKYFFVSEQTPCAIFLSVTVDTDFCVKSAGGIGVFPLPNASEKTILYLENSLEQMTAFNKKLSDNAGDFKKTLRETFVGGEIEILEEREVKYRCSCSHERIENALFGIDKDELNDMIEKDNGAKVNCAFCASTYEFSADELTTLLKKRKNI